MVSSFTLDQLNRAGRLYFVNQLGSIFEHSPWVAEGVVDSRPFASRDELHQAMCNCVRAANGQKQMELICAHPQLAGKAAIRGELTEHSTMEQRGAELDQCSAEEFNDITELNGAYQSKFGFPFIIAVKGHDRASIIAAMRARLNNNRDEEVVTALAQIERIAGFRLESLISSA